MIRKAFRKDHSKPQGKIDKLIEKYNLPRAYLSINRRTVTRGIFVGLFWAFIPMPFQMAGVLAVAAIFRFNVPVAIAMVWLSNPLTMPPMYYMEYLTGNLILGRDGLDGIQLSMEWFKNHWDDIIVPLYTGTAFYSIIVSSLIYGVVNLLWIQSVKQEKRQRVNRQKAKKAAKK